MKRILLLCTGNTCRSPMAQAFLQRMLDEAGVEAQVNSAGIFAANGHPASENAVKVMQEYGLDLSEHRSRPLTLEMLQQSDLILAMEAKQVQQLASLSDNFKTKIHTLKGYARGVDEFPGGGYDVMDPFMGDIEVYRKCAAQIKKFLEQALPRIKDI